MNNRTDRYRMEPLRWIQSALFIAVFASFSSAQAGLHILPPAKSFEEERAQAAAQHDQMMMQSGGEVENEKLAAYIREVGQIVVENSDMPEEEFVFTTLKSPVVNAWTVGGGYVYITRGMLAIMNDEAELVSVLAHEAGHVTARHTAYRESKMNWKLKETQLLALLTGSPLVVGTKAVIDTGGFLSYSRKQEREADELGFKTLQKAGYDLDGMTGMLSSLQRYVRLEGVMVGRDLEKGTPSWLSDHPDTDERIRKASIRAKLAGVADKTVRTANRDSYLDAIDGMGFGDDPALGAVIDGTFYHSNLGFSFPVPEGLVLQNLPEAVIGTDQEQKMVMLLGGMQWPEDRSLEEYAASVWTQFSGGRLGPIDEYQTRETGAGEALFSKKKVELTHPLQRKAFVLDLETYVYRLNDETVVHMAFATQREDSEEYEDLKETLGTGFKKLSDEEIAAIPRKVVRVLDVKAEDSLGSFAEQMAFDDFQLDRFKSLNAIETDDDLQTVGRVKVILWDE